MCFLRFVFTVCYFIFASCYAAASGRIKMNILRRTATVTKGNVSIRSSIRQSTRRAANEAAGASGRDSRRDCRRASSFSARAAPRQPRRRRLPQHRSYVRSDDEIRFAARDKRQISQSYVRRPVTSTS